MLSYSGKDIRRPSRVGASNKKPCYQTKQQSFAEQQTGYGVAGRAFGETTWLGQPARTMSDQLTAAFRSMTLA